MELLETLKHSYWVRGGLMVFAAVATFVGLLPGKAPSPKSTVASGATAVPIRPSAPLSPPLPALSATAAPLVVLPERTDAGTPFLSPAEQRVFTQYGLDISRAVHETEEAYRGADDAHRAEAEEAYFAALNLAPKLPPGPKPAGLPPEDPEMVKRAEKLEAEWTAHAEELADDLSSKPFAEQERELAVQKRAFYERYGKDLLGAPPVGPGARPATGESH